MIQQTFSIIKPDAMKRNLDGQINALIQQNGFKIVAQKLIHMSIEEAKGFYIIHKDRPFYQELTEFMSSYPVVVQVLEKNNAVEEYRQLMGATNPMQAEKGTIRAIFGLSIGENSVHGSDSAENAKIEINYFFTENEIHSRF